jgi:hypothetical protein
LGDMDTGYCMEQKVPGRHSGEVIARQADSWIDTWLGEMALLPTGGREVCSQ